MHVVLVNRSVGSLSIHPVSGKSGKLYGQALLRPELRGPAFKMSLEEYEKATDDLIGNTFAGQQWIPLFVQDAPVETKQEVQPPPPTEPIDPKKPVRALLAMFAVNDLRSLAKKLEVETQGSRDTLIEAISEKVSTE